MAIRIRSWVTPLRAITTGFAAILILVALAVALRRRLEARRRLNLAMLSYLIVALTGLYVIGRSATLDILTGNPGYRYFWVQRLCLLLLLFLLIEPLFEALRGRKVHAALEFMDDV